MNSVRKYITGNFIAMAVTLLLCLVISYWFKPAWSNLRVVTAVLFFVISVLSFLWLQRFAKGSQRKYISGYMLVKSVRLLLLIVFAIIVCACRLEEPKWFLLFFGLFYLVLLVTDTIFFYNREKRTK